MEGIRRVRRGFETAIHPDDGRPALSRRGRRRRLPHQTERRRKARRKAIVEKYKINWSREVVRKVLANTPVYMMWDDHDIRDGWGSGASDSETLVARHPRGKRSSKMRRLLSGLPRYLLALPGSHNPRPSDGVDPALAQLHRRPADFDRALRHALRLPLRPHGRADAGQPRRPRWLPRHLAHPRHAPMAVHRLRLGEFGAGGRGAGGDDADADRFDRPGRADDDADGRSHRRRGGPQGRRRAERTVPETEATCMSGPPSPTCTVMCDRRLGFGQLNLGSFKISNIDEARDQWSHKFARKEQGRLLLSAGARARQPRRRHARGLLFVSGDIHVGARFTITCADPPYEALSLTSSGISTIFEQQPMVHALLDTCSTWRLASTQSCLRSSPT